MAALSGCSCPIAPQGVIDQAKKNSLTMKKYISLMEKGKTTRKLDARMLRTNAKHWADLERSLGGIK